MKQEKNPAGIIALLLVALFACFAMCFPKNSNKSHICIDATHATCDGNCECDGLGCNK